MAVADAVAVEAPDQDVMAERLRTAEHRLRVQRENHDAADSVVQLKLAAIHDAIGDLVVTVAGLQSAVRILERRLVPAAWSAMAFGLVGGWALAVAFQSCGG